ncbi:MAG: DHH family phosphoesterase [Thermoleophilaceae bacterium]|nr:DHH family phosphoesterase [Thermoleophilaceae bacterium]
MSDRAAILERLQSSEKFFLTTHENPDGDAIGSLTGMHGVLQALGKDSVMFMRANEFPLPFEYRYLLGEDQVIHFEPTDLDERTVIFLDCGNFDRMEVDFLKGDNVFIINIDHHHDNTCFGALNLVEGGASCTGEIVYSLMQDLGVELTPQIAEALYVAMVTDTGCFMYQNTGPAAHLMAADLIERGGVEVHHVYERLFEGQPFAKLQLLARGLSSIERFDGGLLTVAHLTRADFEETGSEETFSEGVVDHARAVSGTAIGALVRELTGPGREHMRKVSLRAADERIDVSVIARGFGGGGHRQAAGATTEMSFEEVTDYIRAGITEQLGNSPAPVE